MAVGCMRDLNCLADPDDCGGPLLDPAIATTERRHGYRFVFIPGRTALSERNEYVNRQAARGREHNLPESDPHRTPKLYFDYLYIAIPNYAGITGKHGFCVDGALQIYWYLPNELDRLHQAIASAGDTGWDGCPMSGDKWCRLHCLI